MHPPRIDLTGQKFGKLTVLEWTTSNTGKGAWKCRCDCGNITVVLTNNLRRGNTKSCGCLRKKLAQQRGLQSAQNLIGKRYGKLTVKRKTDRRQRGSIIWECLCDCGNITYVRTDMLNYNKGTRSCGCCEKISRGEEKIKNILDRLSITYYQQYSFKDCYNPNTNHLLYFDFYLPDYKCCIEFDGEQHFKGWSNDKNNLKQNQFRDNLKNKYCENNNLKMIRIPYFDLENLNDQYLESLL